MTKYQVAELEGALLDAAVARASGFEVEVIDQGENPCSPRFYARLKPTGAVWWPSTHWVQGGPIIERERIALSHDVEGYSEPASRWCAECGLFWDIGATPLVAAMRAYVRHKLGGEVDLWPAPFAI